MIEDPALSIQTTPQAFVEGLLPLLTSPSLEEVNVAAKEALTAHRRLRRLKTPGPEAVIESLYRCRITHWLQSKYSLQSLQLPLYLNSSHLVPRRVCTDQARHDHLGISDREWEESWEHFCDHYRKWVDTPLPDKKNPGKADLFFAVSGGIVSIEFKYELRAIPECIKQMRRYLTHAATVLVVYGVAPVSVKFEDTIHMIRHKIASSRAYVVAISGPPVHWPST